MQQFGEKTAASIFFKGAEAHKLHEAFTVAEGETIYVGQPVKLNADGELVAAVTGEAKTNIIGYSIHRGTEKDVVTVAMKAYATIFVKTGAAVNAGPVEYAGQHGTDAHYPSVAISTGEAKQIGWALDKAAGANAVIRVAII